ncbi:hypothetical protein BC833DRAFT_92829 [Globomyces pollinis-pini]|nr:hypothetical protein BC833DRAFT_92829 [Globomyces pollinis-pini]
MLLFFLLPLGLTANPAVVNAVNQLTGSSRVECTGPGHGNLPAVRYAPWRIPVYRINFSQTDTPGYCLAEKYPAGYVPADRLVCIRSKYKCRDVEFCQITDKNAQKDHTDCDPPIHDQRALWVYCSSISCSDPTNNCFNYCTDELSLPVACGDYPIWNPYGVPV